jgi:putative membrane protein
MKVILDGGNWGRSVAGIGVVIVIVLLSMGGIFAQTAKQPAHPDLHSTPPQPRAAAPQAPADSAQAPAASDRSETALKLEDILQNFLTHAYYHGRAELYLAQMASTRAVNSDVKNFAGTIIADHSRVDRELFSLAKKKGLKIERQHRVEENPLYKAMLSRLSELSGPEFDVAYLEQTEENHSLELQQYMYLAGAASDGDTQLFAAQQVSRVRDRLLRAHKILKASEHQVTAQSLGIGFVEAAFQGTSRSFPVERRASRSRWACAASSSLYSFPMRT